MTLPVNDREIEVGSLVRLRSGGTLMTVARVENNLVTCDWDESGKRKSKEYDRRTLNLVREEVPDELEIARRIAFLLTKATGKSDLDAAISDLIGSKSGDEERPL